MNALPLMLGVLCFIAIAYRYYSAFIATKVLILDDSRQTPSHRLYDGQNYFPTNKWVLFGHHFAAITGAGPLIGPVLLLNLASCRDSCGWWWASYSQVQFTISLFSLPPCAAMASRWQRLPRKRSVPLAGFTAAIAILFIVIIALAGLGLAVVNALRESSWGTFTIAATIPIAFFMGLYMYRFRKGQDPRSYNYRRHRPDRRGHIWQVDSRLAVGFLVYSLEERNHRLYRDLWSGGFHPARLDAALPSRLPIFIHETGHHRVSHHRRLRCASRPENAGLQPVCGGWRPDHPRQAVSFRVYHNCVWRHLRISCTGRIRNNTEDDLPGVAHSPDWLWRHVDGRCRWRRVVDCGLGALSGRLFRHQRGTGKVCPAWDERGEPART